MAETNCTACGTPWSVSVMFCARCGAPVSASEQAASARPSQPIPSPMIGTGQIECGNCAVALNANARFCPDCGAELRIEGRREPPVTSARSVPDHARVAAPVKSPGCFSISAMGCGGLIAVFMLVGVVNKCNSPPSRPAATSANVEPPAKREPSLDGPLLTKGGYFAASTLDAYDRVTHLAAQKDAAAIEVLVDRDRELVRLPARLHVVRVDFNLFRGAIKIRQVGKPSEYWVPRDAVEPERPAPP